MGIFKSRPKRPVVAPKEAWDPSTWATRVPLTHLDNFGEVFRAAWENRGALPYAWRILNGGCCDGCALGTDGLKDWTVDGVHLCNVRLRLLRLNTLPRARPRPLDRRRGAASVARPRPAGARPRPVPDGAPSRRSRLHARRLGRRARPDRRSRAHHDPRAHVPLPDQPRHPQRDLLPGPEGDARPGHQQRRQRRARLPRAQHGRPQGDARRLRHHLLVPRPDRYGRRHVRRLEPRQEPAGAR